MMGLHVVMIGVTVLWVLGMVLAWALCKAAQVGDEDWDRSAREWGTDG
jgi:hypothetical protein